MNKYRIEVKEITTYETDIEAETKEEAINKGEYLAMSSNLQTEHTVSSSLSIMVIS